jgi:hypothetical protein
VPWKIPHGMAYAELVGVPAASRPLRSQERWLW